MTGVVAAASCLLGEHWEKLEEAAKVLISEHGEDGCLLPPDGAASARNVADSCSCRDLRDQVVRAVSFLVACNKAVLTDAARQVLLDNQTTPGERQV